LLPHGRPLSGNPPRDTKSGSTPLVAPRRDSYPSQTVPWLETGMLNRLAVSGKTILAGLQGPSEKGVKNHQHQNKASRYGEIQTQKFEIKKTKI